MGRAAQRLDFASIMPPDLARTFGTGRSRVGLLPIGIHALDEALGGGFPRGAVTEIMSESGHGGDWLAFRAILAAAETCAVLDHDGSFHPPGAAAMGIDLARLLVIRESRHKEALWALERMAREPALKVVLAWMPGLNDTTMRRLQLAAESSGQVLLLWNRSRQVPRVSWGALRLSVRTVSGDEGRVLAVEVLRARGGRIPGPVRIEIDNGPPHSVRAFAVLQDRAPHALPRRLA